MVRSQTVFVAGHHGMVGSAILSRLRELGYVDIVTADHAAVDLRNQMSVQALFSSWRIHQVYLAASVTGATTPSAEQPADVLYDNLMIQANVIQAAHSHGVQHLMFISEADTHLGPSRAASPGEHRPDTAAQAWSVAKLAGLKLCESFSRQHGRDYRTAILANVYGPHDNFGPLTNHIIPALIRLFHEASTGGVGEVLIPGSSSRRLAFLHADDMASVTVKMMEMNSETWRAMTGSSFAHINVGPRSDCSLGELAQTIATMTAFKGRFAFDEVPTGDTADSVLDVTRLKDLGWNATIDLQVGLRETYRWYQEHACGPVHNVGPDHALRRKRMLWDGIRLKAGAFAATARGHPSPAPSVAYTQ